MKKAKKRKVEKLSSVLTKARSPCNIGTLFCFSFVFGRYLPVMSKQALLYIELDQDIQSILEKIQSAKADKVRLVVPPGAFAFQDHLNIQLILQACEKASKTCVFITKDQQLIYRLKKEKAYYAESLSGPLRNPYLQDEAEEDDTETKSEKSRSRHFAARKNDREKTPVKKRIKERLSLIEIENEVKEQKQQHIQNPGFFDRFKSALGIQSNTADDGDETNIQGKKSQGLLFSVFTLSILLFFFVVYVALPSAQITIRPQIKELSYATNIALTDNDSDVRLPQDLTKNHIPSNEITLDMEKQFSFPATGERFEGEKARGEITIYNEHHKPKSIIPSRFATKDGLVFWTQSKITIPPRTEDSPGEITVPVVADDYDVHGKVIGDRGNIEAGKLLVMPAIPYLSPRFYYAKNQKPFSGGDIEVITYITEMDIAAAKQKLKEKVKAAAAQSLREYIVSKNKEEDTNYALLDGDRFIEVDVKSWDIPENLEGKEVGEFALGAKVEVRGRIYDHEALLKILEDGLHKKVHPDMYVREIAKDSLEYNFLERDEKNNFIKIEASLKAITSYNFQKDSYTGKRLHSAVMSEILGKDKRKAKAILHNFPEISESTIDLWPFWNTAVPKSKTNVDIRIIH